MPLGELVDEAMTLLGTEADEIVVERARRLRDNPGPGEASFVGQFNDAAARGRPTAPDSPLAVWYTVAMPRRRQSPCSGKRPI